MNRVHQRAVGALVAVLALIGVTFATSALTLPSQAAVPQAAAVNAPTCATPSTRSITNRQGLDYKACRYDRAEVLYLNAHAGVDTAGLKVCAKPVSSTPTSKDVLTYDACRFDRLDALVQATTTPTTTPTTERQPFTITTGGTYSGGAVRSTNSSVAAIRIETTEPVTITGMTIYHAGVAIQSGVTDAQVTVTNNTFAALPPSTGTNTEQQAVRAWEPATLVVERNTLNGSHGVQVSADNSPARHATSTLRIRYNSITDVGKYAQPSLYQGAVHLDNVYAPNGQITWNRIINHHGKSQAEDVIAASGGTGGALGQELTIAYNLVNGAYPISGDGSTYTGGAFDLGDISGSYIVAHHDFAINYTNNGFMIPSGHDIKITDSVAVYDGIADDGARISTPYGWGLTVANLYSGGLSANTYLQNNRAAHYRWNNNAWDVANYQWNGANGTSQNSGGQTSLGTPSSALEQQAVDEFEGLVTSNGVTIGAS